MACDTIGNKEAPPIVVTKGADKAQAFRVAIGGVYKDMTTLSTAVLTVKEGSPDGTTVLDLTLADGELVASSTTLTANFTAAQTDTLERETYWYQLILTFADGSVPPYPPGQMEVV